MAADLRTTPARVVRAGGPAVVALAAVLALAGCGGSTETVSPDVEAENRELSQENERLRGEVERLQGEVERLQAEVEDARETGGAEPEAPATEPTAQEEEVGEAEPEGSSGGGLAVAGPGEVEGEELPEAMPEDFPIPAGAVVDYVSEMGYNFSLDFVIDRDFETTTGFYDEQPPGAAGRRPTAPRAPWRASRPLRPRGRGARSSPRAAPTTRISSRQRRP